MTVVRMMPQALINDRLKKQEYPVDLNGQQDNKANKGKHSFII